MIADLCFVRLSNRVQNLEIHFPWMLHTYSGLKKWFEKGFELAGIQSSANGDSLLIIWIYGI